MTAYSELSSAGLPLIRARRRGPAVRLRDALLRLAEYKGQVLAHEETPWASITYTGARHGFTLMFAGEQAVNAGERLIAELAEHEFTIAGQLVADAEVLEVEHRVVPSPRLVVCCEVLMLEDG